MGLQVTSASAGGDYSPGIKEIASAFALRFPSVVLLRTPIQTGATTTWLYWWRRHRPVTSGIEIRPLALEPPWGFVERSNTGMPVSELKPPSPAQVPPKPRTLVEIDPLLPKPEPPWGFVERSNTGMPVSELKPPSPAQVPPKPRTLVEIDSLLPKPEFRQDLFSLPEGAVTVTWPGSLSPDSYQDFGDWLDILKRKIGRSVLKPEIPKD